MRFGGGSAPETGKQFRKKGVRKINVQKYHTTCWTKKKYNKDVESGECPFNHPGRGYGLRKEGVRECRGGKVEKPPANQPAKEGERPTTYKDGH